MRLVAIVKTHSRIISALGVAMLAGGVVRATLPVLSEFVVEDFHLSRSQFGLLLAVFAGARALGALVMGRVTDRIGGRNLLLVRYAGIFAGTAGTALAPNFIVMMATLAFTGFVVVGANPGSNKLVGQFVPEGSRGSVTGIKQAGGQIGVLLGGAVLPSLAIAGGWRASIGWTLLVPTVGAAVLVLLIPRDTYVPPQNRREMRWAIATSGEVRPLILAGIAMGAGVSVVFGFLPLYAQEAVGMTPMAAGGLAALMATLGFVGRIAWGLQSDRSRHISGVLLLLALLSVISVTLVAGATGVGAWLIWVGAALAGSSLEAWNTVANVAVLVSVDLDDAGSATGLMMVGWITGAVFSPYLFGVIADRLGYTYGWLAVAGLFGIAAAISARWWHKLRSAMTQGLPVAHSDEPV